MFGKKNQPPIKSLIAEGSFIEGNLNFTEGLRIDGDLIGNIAGDTEHRSILIVGETAHVTGEISASIVIISGQIEGSVYASELLELDPKANIHGDVHYTALEMHQGALITGRLRPLIPGEVKTHIKLAANNA